MIDAIMRLEWRFQSEGRADTFQAGLGEPRDDLEWIVRLSQVHQPPPAG